MAINIPILDSIKQNDITYKLDADRIDGSVQFKTDSYGNVWIQSGSLNAGIISSKRLLIPWHSYAGNYVGPLNTYSNNAIRRVSGDFDTSSICATITNTSGNWELNPQPSSNFYKNDNYSCLNSWGLVKLFPDADEYSNNLIIDMSGITQPKLFVPKIKFGFTTDGQYAGQCVGHCGIKDITYNYSSQDPSLISFSLDYTKLVIDQWPSVQSQSTFHLRYQSGTADFSECYVYNKASSPF